MPEPNAPFAISPDGPGWAVSGEVDAHTAPLLAGVLDPLPDGNDDIVLDVSRVEFIDSSGLRVLVDAHQRAKDAGRCLVLARPSKSVVRLLEISGLSDHLAVRDEA